MKALILFGGWCILFVLCWPVALLALVLFPVVWLVSLPLRLIGISIEAIFALVRALLFLPGCSVGNEAGVTFDAYAAQQAWRRARLRCGSMVDTPLLRVCDWS